MTRPVARTRTSGLALAACLLAHAAVHGLAEIWLGEPVAMSELGAAVLLSGQRTRPLGVIIGAAASALGAMSALLAGEFAFAVVPLLLLAGLVALGRWLDDERNGGRLHRRASEI